MLYIFGQEDKTVGVKKVHIQSEFELAEHIWSDEKEGHNKLAS